MFEHLFRSYCAEEAGGDTGGTAPAAVDPPPATPEGDTSPPPITGMDWRIDLPEDLRGNPTIQNAKERDTFIKNALEWQSEMGRRVRPPDAPENQQAWAEFGKRLPGYPETPEGYREAVQAQLPEGVEVNAELLSGAFAVAHQYGYSPHQLAPMVAWYVQNQMHQNNLADAAAQQEERDWETQLNARWGASAPQMLNNNRAFITMSTPDKALNQEVISFFNETGVANHPKVAEWIYRMSLQVQDSMAFVSEDYGSTIPSGEDFAEQEQKLGEKAAETNDDFMRLVRLHQIKNGVQPQASRRY